VKRFVLIRKACVMIYKHFLNTKRNTNYFSISYINMKLELKLSCDVLLMRIEITLCINNISLLLFLNIIHLDLIDVKIN
jgi:hypothetical protein